MSYFHIWSCSYKSIQTNKSTHQYIKALSPPGVLLNTANMQLFSSVLAVAASIFVIVSAEEQAKAPEQSHPRSRASHRTSQKPIGGDSSVWGPPLSTKSSYKPSCKSSYETSCEPSFESCYESSSSSCYSPYYSDYYGCNYPFGLPVNPLNPAVSPLNPISCCDPLYGPGYGAFPGPCGLCGPYPCENQCPLPCPSPCPRRCERSCSPKGRGVRRYAVEAENACAPYYVYMTASQTSTYSSTLTVSLPTTFTTTTVSYTLFTIAEAPITYYNGQG